MYFQPLWWGLLLVPLIWVLTRSLVQQSRKLFFVSFLTTIAGFILICLGLCRPFWLSEIKDIHVVFLIDVSASVEINSIKTSVEKTESLIKNLRQEDSWTLLTIGNGIRKYTLPKLKQLIKNLDSGISDDTYRSESYLGESILQSRLSFPAGKGKKIILFSDGNETSTSLKEALKTLKEDNIVVEKIIMNTVVKAEAFVAHLKSNTQVAFNGEKIRLTAKIYSNVDQKVTVKFNHRGIVEGKMQTDLKAGKPQELVTEITLEQSGKNIWSVEIEAKQDNFIVNNKASVSIEVKGKPRILLLHQKPSDVRFFVKALRKQEMDVETRGKKGLPSTLIRMLTYDAIILGDYPATQMSARQMIDLNKYVTEYGGGLIMLGSENSFGLGGYYKTPVEDVLPLVSRYEKEKEKPSLAMALVIDKSGSMSGLPIQLARQAAKSASELLSARDFIAVIAFDSNYYEALPLTSAADTQSIHNAIDTIQASGGTNMGPGMRRAKEILEASTAKIKHVIILGDGQSQADAFEDITDGMVSSNITVSTVALGSGADQTLLSRIAEIGKGRFYATNDPSTVPQIFTKETMEASRSAIKEEPFIAQKIKDENFLSDISFEDAPFLMGYVMTKAKPTAQTLLLTEQGDPLLSFGQFGLGKGLAFTSSVDDNWASEWHEWGGFGKFWGQILRAVVRRNDNDGVSIQKIHQNKFLQLVLKSKDEHGEYETGEIWEGESNGENGFSESVKINPYGVGVYVGKGTVKQQGSYSMMFKEKDKGKLSIAHYYQSYPLEYRLERDVNKSFDSIPTLSKNNLYEGMLSTPYRKPIKSIFIIMGMILLIIGILLRRL